MTQRVFVSQCNAAYWVEVCRHLQKTCGWEPVYWLGSDAIETEIRASFPQAAPHSSLDAVRGIPSRVYQDLPLPALTPEQIKSVAAAQVICLKMMDRMDPGYAFSYAERERLFYTYLRYWTAVLDALQPDLFFTPISPHLPCDYLIYRLCQQRGIKTLMFEQTSVAGYVYLQEDLALGSPLLRQRYQAKGATPLAKSVTLSPPMASYLYKAQSNYAQAMPQDIRKRQQYDRSWRNQVLDLSSPFWLGIKNNLRHPRVLRRTFTKWLFLTPLRSRARKTWRLLKNPPPNYIKLRAKKVEDSWLGGVGFWREQRQGRQKRRALARHYAQLCTPQPALDTPYILVSLNYQPERTTLPCGDVYSDQLLMVDMLAKHAPAGWLIYVKEHPRQFSRYRSRGHMARDTTFYDDLVRLPNVRLLPIDGHDIFELIDQAQAVATVTGKTSWEGVLRGKPALVFGYAWYRDCAGVFYTPDAARCAAALATIQAGYQVEGEKVRLFLQTLEEIGVRAWVDDVLAYQVEASDAENAQRLAQAIEQYTL